MGVGHRLMRLGSVERRPRVSSSAVREGLYETLTTEAIEGLLERLEPELEVVRASLEDAEASDRLALHFGRILRRAVESLPAHERARRGVIVLRALVKQLTASVEQYAYDPSPDSPLERPDNVLVSIRGRRPDGSPDEVERPLTPLLDTTLLTNSPGEPRVGLQVLKEIDSADQIDVVMAFIRSSGLRPLLPALRRHCEAGKPLRVLTTTYTGSTQRRALDALTELGAKVRVSYDTTSTRLHAKAWLFHRTSGFSTAYIGSSNLTHSAQVDGLERNVRVSGARNPDVIEKVTAVFQSYWEGGEFEPYDPKLFDERTAELDSGREVILSPIEIRLEPFQERLLEEIEVARRRGHHANLLVSATGTGKTVMAAVDYARLRDHLPRSRLLFVAHRQEILERSRATFGHALRDPTFGELWVGGARPKRFDHVFASIQSLAASGLEHLEAEHFDVVIVDEFHHAAASSYRALLDHVRPRELLGLTATPERSDGLPILDWFDGQIAAELRLWDAIDQHRLTPFRYHGVHDGTDLTSVPWRRGHGYDVEGLTNVLTADDVYARRVLQSLSDHVDDVGRMRALGFCVSVTHARFMTRLFNEHGVPAVAVWSDTPADERRAALENLRAGRVNVVFSVDLFNEGVDLPTVDTLLMLRPTDSGTLFLQQLGRGLRKAPGKSTCLVLDFVGHHRTEFRFDRRFRALLGGTRRDVERQIEAGLPYLPAGCHLELDPVASNIVLRSIRKAVPSKWKEKASELRSMAEADHATTLAAFLDQTGLELDDVYAGEKSWSDLKTTAEVPTEAEGPREKILRRACGRLLHVDDTARLGFYRALLAEAQPPDVSSLAERERRLVRMLVGSVVASRTDQDVTKETTLQEGVDILFRHRQVCAELCELFEVLERRLDHAHEDLTALPDVPLRVHARYSRIEILAGFGVGNGDLATVPSWQQGVRWVREIPADLLAFTLDKTKGDFSPTTRYRDYAISRELIHWESQSWTRADSDTGLRYQRHAERGSHVLLFARVSQDDRAFFFLGPATYASHASEQPMGITWRLQHPLPGDLFQTLAAAVA